MSAHFARLGADLDQHGLVKQLHEQRITIICNVGGWLLGTEAEQASASKVPAQRPSGQLF